MKQSIILFLAILCVLILTIFFSPIFNLREIAINKMERYSKDEILTLAEFNEGVNLLSLSKGKVKKNLMKNPYFENVEIEKQFPSTIKINISERKVLGYVPHMGTYLYIDESGLVLESGTNLNPKLPVFVGIQLESFILGKALDAANIESFDSALKISDLLKRYDFEETNIRVDVTDPMNIHIFVNDIDIFFGSIVNAEKKVKVIYGTLQELPPQVKGTLYLNDEKETYRFQYLS